jgi:DNA-binding transcriptional ArsR family regulator
MNPETILAGTASLFLALGDKTRLRLLNLMRDREICVSSFTGVLGQSQPLISRHLAYLRNSGIVEARRDGKWMHYGISPNLDENTGRLLFELFKWMEQQEGLSVDRERYFAISGITPPPSANDSVKAAGSPRRPSRPTARTESALPEVDHPGDELPDETEHTHDFDDEPDNHSDAWIDDEPDAYPTVRHNELEDFLL